MQPEFPGGTYPLCSPIPYHTVDFLSVLAGAVFNPEIVAVLPVGLEIIPGSCQMAYPTGTGFIDIPDPQDLGNNRFLWDIAMLNDEIDQNGLPGTFSNPENQLQIRFETIANCDFIAGSYIIFEASGEQNCPDRTNNLTKAGEPINIDNAVPTYDTNITITQGADIVCNDETTLNIEVTTSNNTVLGDSVFVVLPPGITYIPGTYTSIENAADSSEVTIMIDSGQESLTWPLVVGVTPDQSIRFEIGVAGFAALECGQELVFAQTVSTTDALCVATNEDCSILVETGSSFVNIEINRPDFEISSFSINLDESFSTLQYDLVVENSGSTSIPPTVVDFYIDNDGNGMPSAADTWLFADSITQAIGQNGSFLLSGMVDWDMNNDFCSLMAYIDPEDQCACDETVALVQSPINLFYPEVGVCSDLPAIIGIAETPGHTYQWTPENGVVCLACASTEIVLINDSEEVQTLDLTLIESVGADCYIYHNFILNISPSAQIFAESDSLCQGSTLELTASEGLGYVWTGPGVDGDTSQVVLVSPTANTTYTVAIDNGTDCMGTASIDVVINELPVANAGEDQITCNSLAGNIGPEEPNEDYTYSWSPSDLLSNPVIPNPIVLTNEPTIFTLTVTDENGCTDTDEVFTYFGDSLMLTVSGGTEICIGGSTTLSVAGAETYEWSPAVDCTSSNCDVVQVSPTETTLYTVVATDTLGCMDSVMVLVAVVEEINTSESIALCAGETIIIEGEPVSEPGEYCETFMIGDCDSTHCVTVSLLDTFYVETSETICAGDTTMFNGEDYYESGIYCDTFPTQGGCDSVLCLILTVDATNVDTTYETICEGESTLFYGTFYDTEGIYSETDTQPGECDSIHYLVLTVEPLVAVELSETICDGEVFELNGNLYEEAGIYTDILPANEGCDTIVTLTLSVEEAVEANTSATICEGDLFELNDNFYGDEGTGIYIDTLSSDAGCDSIITTIDLTVLPNQPLDISINGTPGDAITIEPGETVILTVTGGDSYTWMPDLDCVEPCDVIEVSPENTTVYTVSEINEDDCFLSDAVTVNVPPIVSCNDLKVAVPTLFTPGSRDEDNRFFKIFYAPDDDEITVAVQSMIIFNRWGQKIFESTDPNAEWDGTYKDADAPADVYVFIVEVVCTDTDTEPNPPIKLLQGEITLIR